MTARPAMVVPAGVWLSPEGARSILIGLASLDSLLRRHRSAHLTGELAEVRQTLTRAIDVLSVANVNALDPHLVTEQAGEHLLDATTAAQVLGISPGAVRDRARRGNLPARKVGGRWLVDLTEFVAVTKEGRTCPVIP